MRKTYVTWSLRVAL